MAALRNTVRHSRTATSLCAAATAATSASPTTTKISRLRLSPSDPRASPAGRIPPNMRTPKSARPP